MAPRPGPTAGLARGVFWALLFTCCLGLAFAAAFASAEPVPYEPPGEVVIEPELPESVTACPEGPGVYEGEDPVVAELRSLRIAQAEFCAAVVSRQREQLRRTFWALAEAVDAADQRVLANTLLSESRDRLEAPVPVEVEQWSEADPLVTQDADTEDLVASVDASGESIRSALWFLIGLLAMLGGSALYRHLKP